MCAYQIIKKLPKAWLKKLSVKHKRDCLKAKCTNPAHAEPQSKIKNDNDLNSPMLWKQINAHCANATLQERRPSESNQKLCILPSKHQNDQIRQYNHQTYSLSNTFYVLEAN
jgi:hypothetical protein